ncbi:hypothetical protein, partial [Streptomyces sp. MBT97]|uniref:hypothetical protein n=1 Tax=Streptomyces sp. MBT97 TaxID=2800411 RepID=UPI001F38BE87
VWGVRVARGVLCEFWPGVPDGVGVTLGWCVPPDRGRGEAVRPAVRTVTARVSPVHGAGVVYRWGVPRDRLTVGPSGTKCPSVRVRR